MALNRNTSFEISFSEIPTADPPKCLVKTPKKAIETLHDITKKLEEANDRRKDIVSETREKNTEHIKKVVTQVQKKKCDEEEKVTSIRESLEMDLALKSKRREQIIEARLDTVKKEIDKVTLRNSFCDDSFNKENLETKQEKIQNRLKDASERRIQSLEDTKQRNSEIVKHALEVSERVRQMHQEKTAEIRNSVEKDFSCKAERREEQIRAKINSAKKRVDRVTETRARRSLNQSYS